MAVKTERGRERVCVYTYCMFLCSCVSVVCFRILFLLLSVCPFFSVSIWAVLPEIKWLIDWPLLLLLLENDRGASAFELVPDKCTYLLTYYDYCNNYDYDYDNYYDYDYQTTTIATSTSRSSSLSSSSRSSSSCQLDTFNKQLLLLLATSRRWWQLIRQQLGLLLLLLYISITSSKLYFVWLMEVGGMTFKQSR